MDEHELHQRLHRAVEGATPDSARLWENVMEASEHARKTRNAKRTAITLAVLAFAIGTPVAIKLAGSEPKDPGFANGGSGTPTATPTLQETYTTYVDTELNITFPIPKDWQVHEFEGHRTVTPGYLPSPPEDGDTATVSLAYGDLAPKQGRTEILLAPSGLAGEELIDGNTHWVIVESWPLSPFASFDEPQAVTIWFEATTEALAEDNADGWDLIFDGLRPLYDENGTLADIDALDLKARRGTVSNTDDEVAVNDAVITVTGFMDTRAWIEDYGRFVTDEAMQQYIDLEMPDGTSRRDFPEAWFLETYDIVSADAADANSWEIVVEIDFVKYGKTPEDEERATITERLFVGPGTATDGTQRPNVIRGVADEA